MQLTHVFLSALLSLYRPPLAIGHRIDAHRDRIAEQATEASAHHGVPVSVLLAVGFLETHLGQDSGEGGNWGAPISRTRRNIAGTADHAASALALGFRRCGSWSRAIAHYRCGLCACRRLIGYDARTAVHVVRRLHAATGIELPSSL